MQTNFTEQQLKLKDNKSSEKILKKLKVFLQRNMSHTLLEK